MELVVSDEALKGASKLLAAAAASASIVAVACEKSRSQVLPVVHDVSLSAVASISALVALLVSRS